jgi:two-component SAPR family response regulator
MVPLGRWPTRPYLFVLASLRALVPETFDALDAIEVGPALTTALDAGRALAELRATGDITLAAALPWHDQTQLRCQVPPPLLTELALAAELAGAPGASEVLAAIAHPHRWFERIAATGTEAVARRAQSRIGTLPVRPAYTLELTCFGGLTMARSDGQPVDESRTSRARVRQILARLVLQRRVPRQALAASLWPDLPADKASTNLRVNLRHLQDAMQPDRVANGPTWFVQADTDAIWIAGEGIDADVWRFDDHIRRASDAESSGLPSIALSELRNACELYGGDLFGGVEDLEVELERSRLRSLALSSRCRVGELILARGEPETAMHDAVAALRLEPLSERAQRLFIRCHLAVGSTTTARELGERLAGDLRAAGLAPERETEGLLRQLQVG